MSRINDVRMVTLMPSINKLHTRHPRGEAGTKRSCFVISAVMTPIYIIIAEFPIGPRLLYGLENWTGAFADSRPLKSELVPSICCKSDEARVLLRNYHVVFTKTKQEKVSPIPVF